MFRVKYGVFYSKYHSKKSVAFSSKNSVNLLLSEMSIFTKSMLKTVFLRAKFRVEQVRREKQKPQYIANLLLKTLYIAVFLVPEAGLEPARYFYRGILSPLRLPIPPLGQVAAGMAEF